MVHARRSARLCALALMAGMTIHAPAAESQATGRIVGTVLDAAGQPVVGAQVLVDGRLRVGATGADGGFSVPGVGAGVRRVRVLAMGYAPAEREVAVPGEALRIRLEHTPLALPGIQVTASPGAREASAVAQGAE